MAARGQMIMILFVRANYDERTSTFACSWFLFVFAWGWVAPAKASVEFLFSKLENVIFNCMYMDGESNHSLVLA